MSNNISKVKTSIKAVTGDITAADNYIILNNQVPKTGKINVRCAGTFDTATISVGYLDDGVFSTETINGLPAAFTSTFSLMFECGKHTNVSAGPAIKVAAIGAADLSLTISSID